MYKGLLLHLSTNLHSDRPEGEWQTMDESQWRDMLPYTWKDFMDKETGFFSDHMVCDDGVWARTTKRLADKGGNLLVIDLLDAIQYKSHPEIALPDAWSRQRLRDELARCRDMGLEVIPKMNFSTCHDPWLKEYQRMVSTKIYYGVCSDLIAEAVELFDGPAIFHIGMDEEAAWAMNNNNYGCVRMGKLWWHDLNFFCEEVRKNGARPAMWSDKLWNMTDDEEFRRNVPQYVIQNNWSYRWITDPTPHPGDNARITEFRRSIGAFDRLQKLGYDILSTASNWGCPESMHVNKVYCQEHLDPKHFLGHTIAPWVYCEPKSEYLINQAIDQLAEETADL